MHRGQTTLTWQALCALSVIFCFGPTLVLGQSPPAAQNNEPIKLQPVVVRYEPPSLAEASGSVQVLDKKLLETFKFSDPNMVVLQAPGVYVRQEDAFGLRPNIGIRGASAERSSKIVLMEDGVLFGPAPYSAPAAYYFPLISRMVQVDVIKGPSAILYGPHTVGGAINFKTRDIPEGAKGSADIALGNYWSGRFQGHYGQSTKYSGFLVEGVHLRSSGFKELDGGGPTGFERTEIMAKGSLNTDLSKESFHRVELKAGFSHERSDETYLGLSDADFRNNAYRRYVASQQDKMVWARSQLALTHEFVAGESFELRTTAYRHDLNRTWRKLNRFRSGPSLSDILSDPTSGQRRVYYDVLTGAQDSSTDAEALMIGTNDRTFVSQGLQTQANWRKSSEDWTHRIEAGARLHFDSISRLHTEDPTLMRSGQLTPEGTPTLSLVNNYGSTTAFAAHILYGVTYKHLTLTPGLRGEFIHMQLTDRSTGKEIPSSQNILLPGAGIHYAITQEFGVLAGVHRGFSPTSPGQASDIQPEQSWNYEGGMRYKNPEKNVHAELIGFFSDYSNLMGECRFATGCDESQVDQQYNGGAVHVYGLEAVAQKEHAFNKVLRGRLRATYTFTQSSFQTSFSSENPIFGDVEKGDELPYLPNHQGTLQLGAFTDTWSADTLMTYVGMMREVAGQGTTPENEKTDPYFMVDLVGSYKVFRNASVYLRFENIFHAKPIVSRRPFGARPGKPFLAQVGFKYDF